MVLKSKRVFTGVKLHHYPRLIHKMLDANLVTLLTSRKDVIESSISVV